jgi:hypothetical protein
MRLSYRVTTAALTLGLSIMTMADSADAQAVVPPDPITIFGFNANGSGCPANTVSATITPDGSMLSISYSAMVAEAGPGTTPADGRKNCLLTLGLHVPQGFTYAVVGAEHRGNYSLEPSVVGTQTADYYVSGQRSSLSRKTQFVGDLGTGSSDDWYRADALDVAALVWAPCGRDSIAHVNESVSVNNYIARQVDPNARGMMAQDATDIGIFAVYRLLGRTC